MPSIAVIGVGNMGGGIAKNLLSKNYTVYVKDIDHQKTQALVQLGAQSINSYSQLPNEVSVIIICVVTASQVGDVLKGTDQPEKTQSELGLLSELDQRHTVILCPTIGPTDVKGFASQIQARGASVIDAPMSGGPVRAQMGKMSLMVACTEDVLKANDNLLHTMADPVFYISNRVGDGATTKLINNLLAGVHLVASAEAMVLAEKMGLDLQKTLDVIESSSGQSWIGSERMRRAIHADPLQLEPLAHMTLLTKDTGLALQMGAEVDYNGPLGSKTVETFNQACAAGLSGRDDAAMLTFLRDSAREPKLKS